MTTPSQVILTTANAFNVDPGLLTSDVQTKEAFVPRHVAAYLLTRKLNLSTVKAGKELGGRDHTTIGNALKQVKKRREADPAFNGLILSLETQLDLMERLEGLSVMNIIAIARMAATSRRAAMGLTVHEIMALANSLLEVWAIAQASGVLVEHVLGAGRPEAITELARNIREELSLIAEIKEKPEEEQKNDG